MSLFRHYWSRFNQLESTTRQKVVGVSIMALFVFASVWSNKEVFALINSGYGYGYYGGYGYGYGYSDAVPSTPVNVSAQALSTSSVIVRWSPVTTTTKNTSLNNFQSYAVYYATSSANANSTSGTAWTIANDSTLTAQGSSGDTKTTTITGLTANTQYYFAVYAYDTSSNTSTASSLASATTGSTSGSSSSGGGGGGGGSTLGVTTPTVANPVFTNVATPIAPAPPTILTVPTLPSLQIIAAEASQLSVVSVAAAQAQAFANAAARFVATIPGFSRATAAQQVAINRFIAQGTASTHALGAGERAGVINSFRAAFGRLPLAVVSSTVSASAVGDDAQTKAQRDWSDVVKIAVGRFPEQTSAKAEAAAKLSFRKVYKRAPVMADQHDKAAVTIMAYGLRPLVRKPAAEAAAIKSFKAIFHKAPKAAAEWDIVRAVAYSGATRTKPVVKTVVKASVKMGICFVDKGCKQSISKQEVSKTECKDAEGGSWKAAGTKKCSAM